MKKRELIGTVRKRRDPRPPAAPPLPISSAAGRACPHTGILAHGAPPRATPPPPLPRPSATVAAARGAGCVIVREGGWVTFCYRGEADARVLAAGAWPVRVYDVYEAPHRVALTLRRPAAAGHLAGWRGRARVDGSRPVRGGGGHGWGGAIAAPRDGVSASMYQRAVDPPPPAPTTAWAGRAAGGCCAGGTDTEGSDEEKKNENWRIIRTAVNSFRGGRTGAACRRLGCHWGVDRPPHQVPWMREEGANGG